MNNTNFSNSYIGMLNQSGLQVDNLEIDGVNVMSKIDNVDQQIKDEKTDRIVEDNILTNLISTNTSYISTEISNRIAEDNVLENLIIVNTSAISTNETDISNLENAIENEVSTRISADTNLQTNLNTETTTRASADTGLNDRLDEIENKLYRDEDNNEHFNLFSEVQKNSKIKLYEYNSPIDQYYGFNLTYNGTPNTFSITSHVNGVDTDRLIIPRNNNTKIQLLNSGLLTSKLLTLNANNEIESSNYSDTDISNLDGRLSTAETNIITNITDISALQININAEISNRISADNLLDTRLDSLENDIVNQLGNQTSLQFHFTGVNNYEFQIPYSIINNHGDSYLKIYGISRSGNSGSEKNEILSGLLRFSFSPSSTRIFEQYKRKSNSNQPMFYIECVYPNIKIYCRPHSSYSPYTSVFVEIFSNKSVTFYEPVVVDLGSNVVLSLNSNTTNYIDLYGTLKIPQLVKNKILYLDNNNEIKSSIYTDSDITNLQINISSNITDIASTITRVGNLENKNNLSLITKLNSSLETGIEMIEIINYGFKTVYSPAINQYQIMRMNNASPVSVINIQRENGNIIFPEISNPNNGNLLYLDSNKVIKTCPLWYNETSDILEIDKSIQINSAAQGFRLEGGTRGFSSLTHLYGYRFFNINGAVESYYSNNECKVNGDIIGNNLSINGDITTGYIKLMTSSTTSFHMQHYQIEQYNTDISDTIPIMRIGHDNGRITTNTVYYKYPTGTGDYHFTQLNRVLYQNTADQNNNSRTNAVWGRYSDNYSLNAYRNIKVNGSIIQTSDERIKLDIKPNTKPSLDIINAIKLKEYDYKYRPNESAVKTIGVIAQQVKRDVDDVYGTDIIGEHDKITSLALSDDTYTDLLSVKKEKMYLHLIGAVQRLTQQVNDLQTRLNKLESV